MYAGTPFDPLEAGDSDNFAFDFVGQVGTATIVSTSWTCSLDRGPPEADPSPQSRILSTSAQTQAQVRGPGQVFLLKGAFSVARIGGMPMTAVGSIYLLEATVNLSDGRTLTLNSSVRCAAPGTT